MACAPSALVAQPAKKGAPAKASTAPAEPPKPVAFVAPPRTVSDITAILDSEKPDPEKTAKLVAEADAAPPKLPPLDLAEWHYKRAQARSALGRTADAIADAELAVKLGQGDDYADGLSRYEQFLIRRLRETGERKRALDLIAKQQRAFADRSKGRNFWLNLATGGLYLNLGDFAKAAAAIERNRALFREAQNWPNNNLFIESYLANVEEGAGRLAEARGQFAAAEQSFRRCVSNMTIALSKSAQWPSAPPKEGFETGIDWCTAWVGRVEAKQGRVAQAEADVRRALLSRLSKAGKYHPDTAGILGVLVYVLQEQGRYKEAEQLQYQVVDIYKGLGYPDDAQPVVNANLFVAQLLNMQRRFNEAGKKYDEVEQHVAKWEPSRRDFVMNGLSRVNTLLSMGRAEDALVIAQKSHEREKARGGEKSFGAAMARGFVATALARNGRTDEALAAYKEALPIILNVSSGTDEESGVTAAAAENRTRGIVEGYLRTVSATAASGTAKLAEETFTLADVLRGQSVQRALQASSVRSAAQNPALGALVRNEQDLNKQIGATVGALNNLLAQPSGERDEKAVKDTQALIASLQASHRKARDEIAKRFPDYGNLVNPPPPRPADVQAQLAPDEALLSFYFGRFESFVWVVRKDRPASFRRLGITAAQLDAKVTKLREALEPQAAMISDIPPFDVAAAHELYAQILKPAEDEWRDAKSLIVVTNGALGLLPLSLLPTAPHHPGSEDTLFESYKKVPWLARTHAVTLVPSVSALRTLRQLPAGKAGRGELIAFGDPVFSKEQAEEAAKPVQVADAGTVNVTRGLPLKRRNAPQLDDAKSAQLAQLPRLPDTADELKSIAVALQSDPDKVLNLGKDANERKVKTTDLSGFKIVAFATHGLVPGELDGLSQPALALSAPGVADTDGDGLLTMEEILTLKLDADWVVLSACNTGAGAGAGAEAASGLGRAFFYAGTRALLVTNWSVHSQSARELVTDLFKRQADDPKLARGEALRQATVALIDGKGFVDDGKTQFSYAHPLFWAPYTIIGDGGRR